MARRVFYSFHYKPDNWRAAQVRNIGAIEGNNPASDNDWEAVKKGWSSGDPKMDCGSDKRPILHDRTGWEGYRETQVDQARNYPIME